LAAPRFAALLSDRAGPGGRSCPAATKEIVMYLQPLLARVLLATVSILLLLAGVAAVR
jgi:hypothetical protein